jgi:hypothetical protein
VGDAAAFALFGPVDIDERRERLCRLVAVDACRAVVGAARRSPALRCAGREILSGS